MTAMKNNKLCPRKCGDCKFALVVEDETLEPFLCCPRTVVSKNDMPQNDDIERRAMLNIYQWMTPYKTLCYCPSAECAYQRVRGSGTLSETHPDVFVEMMTDLYEALSLDFLTTLISDRECRIEKGEEYARDRLWLKIHKAIYRRRTGHDFSEATN